ncbi:MAG: hypothetical protein XU15_C0011G0052 [candidate division NC10 bacterium CSP1-5]|nr:MAG: hypothetical protein XU15_C0011G0052 [candidate division NC10 bacterium CSP1-5]
MNKKQLKKAAEEKGHRLGRFTRRKYQTPYMAGKTMYYVAWCLWCGDAALTGSDDDSPVLKNTCTGRRN